MTPIQAAIKFAKDRQPAGQLPRHDCHGVHPNQTHEEWLASVAEKKSATTLFGDRVDMTEKQAFSPLVAAPLAGSLIGGGFGAYNAPKGARPEGFGRGAYQGGGAGLGAILGAGAGGIGGGVLGSIISKAIHGDVPADRRYLPLILALLGAGAGGYGGGKLGWRMAKGVTGDSRKLDKEEEEEEKTSFDKEAISQLYKVVFTPAVRAALLSPNAFGSERILREYMKVLKRIRKIDLASKSKQIPLSSATWKPGEVPARIHGGLAPNIERGIYTKKSDFQLVRQALEKQAFLPKALGALGKGVGHLLSGGGRLWGGAVMAGLRQPGFIPKATAVTGGGLSLAAMNELLASISGKTPMDIPHFGMGGDQPWWDPVMQHDRIDPKKTGFKSLFHMATRPLQTISALTGISRKPGELGDYARVTTGGETRLSEFLSNPKNFKIDPITGQGTVTGDIPIDIADVLMEQVDDFNKKRQRFEDMGIIGRFGYGDNSRRRPGARTYTDPWGRPIRRRSRRRRFD